MKSGSIRGQGAEWQMSARWVSIQKFSAAQQNFVLLEQRRIKILEELIKWGTTPWKMIHCHHDHKSLEVLRDTNCH